MSPQIEIGSDQTSLVSRALDKKGERLKGDPYLVQFPNGQEEIFVVDNLSNTITATTGAGLTTITNWLGQVSAVLEGDGIFPTPVPESTTDQTDLKEVFDLNDPFQIRVYAALNRSGITTVQHLRSLVNKAGNLDHLHIRNVGDKSKGLLEQILKSSDNT